METCINYTDSTMFVSTDENKWKNRIDSWAKEYPNECVITVRPENNDGCMNAKMPSSWLRMRPPKKVNMTEEQRMAAAARMRKKKGEEDEEMEDEE